MHELSIAEALIDQVNSIALHEGSSIVNVTVVIGALAGVDAEALDQAFKIAIEDTRLKKTSLTIENAPARVMCNSCKKESNPVFPFFACQHCNSTDFEIISGRDLILKSVDVDQPA